MLLEVKELLDRKKEELSRLRRELNFRPGLGLIWVGTDLQTEKFINAKHKVAKDFDVDFYLYHFPQLEERQLEAVIQQANQNNKIHGLVLQLPLPDPLRTDRMIQLIDRKKDVDSLRSSDLPAPTAQGIVELLEENNCLTAGTTVAVIGLGRLVGKPLVDLLAQNKCQVFPVDREAQQHSKEIKKNQVLVACTGVRSIVSPDMVHSDMVVVDGSGVDVDRAAIEPLVRMITPERGAIGPLTVLNLFTNLSVLAKRR